MKKIKILAIETSCDETSASIVENGRDLLSEVTSTQIDIHRRYGGVVPEIASRNHLQMLPYITRGALDDANINFNDLDAIAVTYGPGLVGALLVGLSYAKSMAYAANKPLIGIHHIKGHIAANYLEYKDLHPPFVSLVISGGHTNILLVEDYCKITTLGKTLDDAAGEAFDKIARCLGFNYPGGPEIDKYAKKGDKESISFPRVMLSNTSFDFSFSGLKSAVLNYLNTMKMKNLEINPYDISASFQEAVVDILCKKIDMAAQFTKQNTICLSGGVAANSRLKERMIQLSEEKGYKLFIPSPKYCTDNAAMIASCAYYEYLNNNISDIFLNADPSLSL